MSPSPKVVSRASAEVCRKDKLTLQRSAGGCTPRGGWLELEAECYLPGHFSHVPDITEASEVYECSRSGGRNSKVRYSWSVGPKYSSVGDRVSEQRF